MTTSPVGNFNYFFVNSGPNFPPPLSMKEYEECQSFFCPPKESVGPQQGFIHNFCISKSCDACGHKIHTYVRNNGPQAFPALCNRCINNYRRFKKQNPDRENEWKPRAQPHSQKKEQKLVPSAQRMKFSFLLNDPNETS